MILLPSKLPGGAHAVNLRLFCISGCVMVACLANGPAKSALAQASSTSAERDVRWRQDLEALAKDLARSQADFAVVYPSFGQEIRSLTADLPTLRDEEVFLRLMRLMASAHIAHNLVVTPIGMGFVSGLPLTLHWFADGLAVTRATPEYSAALGAHVLSIGGKSPEQFLTDVTPYVSHENETELRNEAPGVMTSRPVLQHFGLIAADGRVGLPDMARRREHC
jgi:hypothetical protein